MGEVTVKDADSKRVEMVAREKIEPPTPAFSGLRSSIEQNQTDWSSAEKVGGSRSKTAAGEAAVRWPCADRNELGCGAHTVHTGSP